MEKFLAVIFFLAITVMLIAARFGLVWAGGNGYVKPLSTTIEVADGIVNIERVDKIRTAEIKSSISRGEKIMVGDNSRVLIRIGEEIIIALDQRTDVIIEKNTPDEVEIKLIRGRLLTKTSWETNQLTISTPRSKSVIKDGTITAVRYDFLDKTSVAPLNTQAKISIGDLSQITNEPREISELEPFTILPTGFNLEAPEVIGFYEWARKY
ncbi:MAG: hypothetical protein V1664_04230 [Candidatus Uhrbacteria bacterium]